MIDREQVRARMKVDGIKFLIVQFVDMHGAAKAKMVPVECFDDAIDVGAGFAGGALWGLGQGPHSHDMLARVDLATYTRLPWMPNTARFAAPRSSRMRCPASRHAGGVKVIRRGHAPAPGHPRASNIT